MVIFQFSEHTIGLTFYQCLPVPTCQNPLEQMTIETLIGLAMCSSLSLFLALKILENKEDDNDMNLKCRRFSV